MTASPTLGILCGLDFNLGSALVSQPGLMEQTHKIQEQATNVCLQIKAS